MRQRIGWSFEDRSGVFEAVVQKRCDELTVVGFAPFGARAFSIRQRGLDVEVDADLVGAWPFPPEYVLADVHRVYFFPIAVEPRPDGVETRRRGDELVSERWSSGRLVERAIEAEGGAPRGRIEIRYEGGSTHGAISPRVRLDNGRYGYHLEIETVSRAALTCAPE